MADQVIPNSNSTLIKYNSPYMVTAKTAQELEEHEIKTSLRVCDIMEAKRKNTAEILNEILPPKEWEIDGKKWKQTVSTVPATASDVIQLQEQLDRRLKEEKAKETGICHIRRELYTQFFDEIIRQVTIVSTQRGLLLFRIRNELTRTLRQLETLFESGTAYAMRKALVGEAERENLEKAIYEKEIELQECKLLASELEAQVLEVEAKGDAERQTWDAESSEELAEMKQNIETLKVEIWSAIFPKPVLS